MGPSMILLLNLTFIPQTNEMLGGEIKHTKKNKMYFATNNHICVWVSKMCFQCDLNTQEKIKSNISIDLEYVAFKITKQQKEEEEEANKRRHSMNVKIKEDGTKLSYYSV